MASYVGVFEDELTVNIILPKIQGIGLQKELVFTKNGKYHNDQGPAHIIFYDNCAIKHWYRKGYPYRINNKPTIEKIYNDGEEFIWQNSSGRYHRTDGPAIVNTRYSEEMWYYEGKLVPDWAPKVKNGIVINYYDENILKTILQFNSGYGFTIKRMVENGTVTIG